MKQKPSLFAILLLLCGCLLAGQAQEIEPILLEVQQVQEVSEQVNPTNPPHFIKISTNYSKGYFAKRYRSTYGSLNQFFTFLPASSTTPASQLSSPAGPYVPKAYNYHDLAFFCKLEVKMEKRAKIPIKVRLGDVDYVDWLEGKRARYGD